MIKKRVFPDDWSGLTDEQASENITYLIEHCKDYKIKKDINCINLDGVKISKGNILNYPTVYIINGKGYRQNTITGMHLKILFDTCVREYRIQQEKEQKSDNIKFICAVGVTAIVCLVGTIFIADQINKEKEFYNKKFKQYEQIKSQIANHSDTVQYSKR